MSDSNSNDTVVPDVVIPLPSVARTLSRTLNIEADEDMEISRKPRGDGTQTTTRIMTPGAALSMGLMKMKTCTTSIEMAQMMVTLIIEQFTMMAEVTAEHKKCYSQKKDGPHLHSRHSPAIEHSKLHRSPTRRSTVLIPQNRISCTDYVVNQVQQSVNEKS